MTVFTFKRPVPVGKEYDDLIRGAMENGYGWAPGCWPLSYTWEDVRVEADSLEEAQRIFKETEDGS